MIYNKYQKIKIEKKIIILLFKKKLANFKYKIFNL